MAALITLIGDIFAAIAGSFSQSFKGKKRKRKE